MTENSRSEEASAYINESRYQVVLLLQRRVLMEQLNKLDEYTRGSSASANGTNSGTVNMVDKLPVKQFGEVIQRRFQTSSDILPGNRVLDDMEISLLGLLDSDSRIAIGTKLSEFMVLTTRVANLDQRALCLYILEKCLSEECKKQFVTEGGYRIFKTWISNAFKDDFFDEISAILKVLTSFPVDQAAVKSCGLDTIIKELKKANVAIKEIGALKLAWNEYLSKQKKLGAAAIKKESATVVAVNPAVVESVRQHIFGMRKAEDAKEAEKKKDQAEAEAEAVVQVEVDTGVDVSSAEGTEPGEAMDVEEKEEGPKTAITGGIKAEKRKAGTASTVGPASAANGESDTDGVVPPAAKRPRAGLKIIQVSSLETSSSPTPSPAHGQQATQHRASAASTTSASGVTKGVTQEQSRGGSSMPSSSSAAGSNSSRKVIDMAAIARKKTAEAGVASRSDVAEKADKPAEIKPGVGGMKKRDRKLSVKWADQVGGADSGALRHVQTFEVDKMGGRDVANWKNKKSHKEREKRERMSERDKVTSQRKDNMHRTVEWSRPLKLEVSMEIIDNSRPEVSTEEVSTQQRRLTNVIEAKYLDESLIPTDPEDDASAFAPTVGHVPPTKTINLLQTPGARNFNDAVNVSQRDDMIYAAASADSSSTVGASGQAPHIVYGSIPSQLHGLEPGLLQIISQDESRMMSLLNPDGSVNHQQVALLRMTLQRGQPPPLPLSNGTLAPMGSSAMSGAGGSGRSSRFSRAGGSGATHSALPATTGPPPVITATATGATVPAPPPQAQGQVPAGSGTGAAAPLPQRVAPGVDSNRLNARKRVPCKWFLSPKGCQHGNACTFGHFARPGAPGARK